MIFGFSLGQWTIWSQILAHPRSIGFVLNLMEWALTQTTASILYSQYNLWLSELQIAYKLLEYPNIIKYIPVFILFF